MSKRGKRETGWELPQRFEKKQKIQKDVALSLVEVKENGKQIKLEEAFKNKLEKVKVPSIHQEIIRYKKMCELRKAYKRLCLEELSWTNEPKSSFNRFLTDHLLEKSSITSKEPLLPCLEDIKEDKEIWIKNSRIYKEIEEDYPEKIKPPIQFVKGIENIKKHFKNYIKALEKINTNVLNNDNEINDFIKNGNNLLNLNDSSIIEKYEQFRNDCHAILQVKLESKTIKIVSDLLTLSSEFSSEISCNSDSGAEIIIDNHDRRLIKVSCDGLDSVFELSKDYFDSLSCLFKKNNFDHSFSNSDVHEAIFKLLARYNAFIGQDFGAGGLQGALPRKLFYYLHKEFDVSMECFASPLNAYFSSFCSAFFDTDCMFGSIGSFFDFYPVTGSFEANPPFCEKLMDKMVDHIEFLLENSNLPLSFIVIIPDWKDASAYVKMRASKYFRQRCSVRGKEHYYRSGLQHCVNKYKLYYESIHDSSIFFMQNESGYSKWRPSTKKCDIIIDAFYSKNDNY